ncbi:MAG: hypothetical protein ACFFCM_13650 [Promethearchaeota archaeon]
MKKTLYKSLLFLSFLVLFGGSLSILMINTSAEPSADPTIHTASMVVFDHEFCDWPHPGVALIEIPSYWQVVGCNLEYTAHMDPDDYYLRAMAFYLDDRGGGIGCYRVGPHDIRGWTILPGQTLYRMFDMSHVQFPRDWPDTGGTYWTFIPASGGYIPGYFSPGEHEITGFVSSQYPGAVQESWISIVLHFEYIDLIGDILNQISSNQDDLESLINEQVSGWYQTYCLKHLRFSRETVDSMIERHLNGGSITTSELFWLKMRFLYIKMAADVPEISTICDNTMTLIDDLKSLV